MTEYVPPPEEPKLVGKPWSDGLARQIQDFLRHVRQLGGQAPARHARTHMRGGGDALPLDKLTLKGDLLTRTSSGYSRLGVGADTFVLTADSGEATGVKWAAASGGSGNAETAMAMAHFMGD